MSYLAMSAEPINYSSNQSNMYNSGHNDDTLINKKRHTNTNNNKTQKFRQPSTQKVNSILDSIHNNTPIDEDDDLGNYQPQGTPVKATHSDNFKPLNPYDFPPHPNKVTENMTNLSTHQPQAVNNDNMDLQDFQNAFMNNAQVNEYYQKLIPGVTNVVSSSKRSPGVSNSTNASASTVSGYGGENQALLEKLNYIINLLEEEQDQRTNSVTEEVVLYSFLGVFMIFIVDSFVKVGKYVR